MIKQEFPYHLSSLPVYNWASWGSIFRMLCTVL
jgi:hypothetical protein